MADRESRIERARELIGQNPEWGKNRINRELRSEFGHGLRRIYVAQLKKETLYTKPTLVEKRYQQLAKEGFLPTEARQLSQLPISSPAMRAYRSERRMFRRESAKAAIPKPAQTKQLKLAYRSEGHWKEGRIHPMSAFRSFIERRALPPEAELPAPRLRLSWEQLKVYHSLIRSGFLRHEALRLAGAPSMPKAFDTKPFQLAIERRIRWCDLLRGQGWKPHEIARELGRRYRQMPDFDPWEFVRQEYLPPRKVVDFVMTAGRTRQAQQAKRNVGVFYKARARKGAK